MASYPFWLGGVAAAMAACCTHPLDLAKVRMQTVSSASGTKRASTITVLRTSITESGFRSIYTGISASLLRQMSYSLVRLGVYEKLKQQINQDKTGISKGTNLIIAAGVAGGLGGIAGNPADILLVRMTSDSVRPPDKRYGYSNAVTGLASLVKEEGVRGLARGLGANSVRAVLMNISQVGSYDFFKGSLLRHPIPVINYQFRDNLLLHTASSLAAGLVATTICAPADVMKSRLMSANGKSQPLQILRESLAHEGPQFLFKGWAPAFVRLGPQTVLLFVFFEQLKMGWAKLTAPPSPPAPLPAS